MTDSILQKFEAINYVLKNSQGEERRQVKKMFLRLFGLAESLWLWQFPKEVIVEVSHIVFHYLVFPISSSSM